MKKGFTLIETLVAITILILAVTGAFAAAQNGISSATFSKDQIIAFYLAQEGVEQIRNMRDRNGITQPAGGWLTGIANSGNPCVFGNACRVDAVNNTVTSCGAPGSCPKLKLNDNGFYSYDTGADSPFTREITLTQVSVNEVTVTSKVTWKKGVLDREFRAVDHIMNWQ